jgi:hypothetical protein
MSTRIGKKRISDTMPGFAGSWVRAYTVKAKNLMKSYANTGHAAYVTSERTYDVFRLKKDATLLDILLFEAKESKIMTECDGVICELY